jgi:hypothetical protein
MRDIISANNPARHFFSRSLKESTKGSCLRPTFFRGSVTGVRKDAVTTMNYRDIEGVNRGIDEAVELIHHLFMAKYKFSLTGRRI